MRVKLAAALAATMLMTTGVYAEEAFEVTPDAAESVMLEEEPDTEEETSKAASSKDEGRKKRLQRAADYTEEDFLRDLEERVSSHETELASAMEDEESILLAQDYADDGLIVDMSPQAGTVSGQDIVDFALQFVGNPYVWGGTSLTDGCDCSGFVLSVYGAFGIDLPHYSGSQFHYGVAINPDILMPGDLVFYGVGGSHHVAIYIGDGKIVHAAGERVGIIVSRMYGSPSGYRRLV